MIIARLHPATDPDGRKYLVGETVSAWPVPVGAPVLLLRVGNVYELSERAPRENRFSREALGSFVERDPEPVSSSNGHKNRKPRRKAQPKQPPRPNTTPPPKQLSLLRQDE